MTDDFPHYLEFRHVNKTFDNPVLVDANFQVNGGETVDHWPERGGEVRNASDDYGLFKARFRPGDCGS